MTKLSRTLQDLHQRAVSLSDQHRLIEARMIDVLREIDSCKLYKYLGCGSLFTYAVQMLNLSESVAYAFISVARKSTEVPALCAAIEAQKTSVAKANRMVSVLSSENAARLIEFAIQHSTRELENEVARLNPKAPVPDRAKPISETLMRLELSMSTLVFEKLKRAQNILASKRSKNAGFEETIDRAITEYLERHDPVIKAERSLAKRPKLKCRGYKQNPGVRGLNGSAVLSLQDAAVTFSDYKSPSKLCARCLSSRWRTVHTH